MQQTFSPDSRLLVTASLDSIIRTFDIPTGRLIDAFRTPSVATSLSFSPTNDFLATSHVDNVGVFLWANRAQYAEASFQTVSEADIVDIGLPTMQEDGDEDGPSNLSSDSLLPEWMCSSHFFMFWHLCWELMWFSMADPDLIGLQSLESLKRSEDVFSSPEQLAEELATLTLLPRTRWQALLKLEVIQVGDKRISDTA